MSWFPGRLRRQRVRRTVLVLLLGLVSLGLVVAMLVAGLDTGDPLASVLGLFVGLAGLALSAADFLRGQEAPPPDPGELADDLARILRAQWLEEAESRRLRDPRVLPLVWSATRRDVGDRAEAVVRAGGGGGPLSAGDRVPGQGAGPRVVRLRLDGRLDGRFEEAVAGLAAGYRQIGSGRLVVLGEPGAGKTVLALLLTLGLLEPRESGGPVPALLPVSSWDPICESLDDWLVRRLAESYYAGRTEIPRSLLLHGLLLPVLDGLDEIPESARRSAVRALNRALGRERPVVVTCRSAEYEDVVKAGSPALHRAPVVEISPVAPRDAIPYLADVAWPEESDWSTVYERLRTRPDSPVAGALSTPLIISMARTVYERCGGQPAELVDEERFPSRHAVEDHLIERFVDAAYAPGAVPAEGEGGSVAPDPAKAREWLTFLARYLHRYGERDLAWWLMSPRLLSAWAAPGVGLGFGVLLAVLVGLGVTWFAPVEEEGGYLIATCVSLGAAFAVLTMLIWYATAGRPPGRPSFAVRGTGPRLRRGLWTGLAMTAVPTVAVIAAMTVVGVVDGLTRVEAAALLDAGTLAGALMVVVGAGVAVHECLNAPPGHAARAEPGASLRDDRRSAVLGALATGAVVGLGAFPVLAVTRLTASLLATVLHGWRGEPPLTDELLARIHELAAWFGRYGGGEWDVAMFIAECFVLPGLVTALLILLSRAWTRFLLWRLIAAARGRLPWRFMGFLADAHGRGVLRGSGGLYQFRHIRLQETLVARSAAGVAREPGRDAAPVRSARRAKAAAAVGALTVVAASLYAFPDDTSTARWIPPHPVGTLEFRHGVVLARDGDRVTRWDAVTAESLPSRSLRRDELIDVGKAVGSPTLSRPLRGLDRTEYGNLVIRDLHSGRYPEDGFLARTGGRPRMLVGYCGGPLLVWDLDERRVVARTAAPRGGLNCHEPMPLSGDFGTLAGVSDDECTVAVWNAASGTLRAAFDVCRQPEGDEPAPFVEAVALSHDGRTLAIGDSRGTVRLWDTRTREERAPLTGHDVRSAITRIAFDAAGTRLATYGSGGSVRLWSLDKGTG
ncbi:NACHT domain-containing protein [Streptomyces sp. NPDC093546]|uniref:NACHT domain-containing protein n=1 Tax=Streptomyces sp. NPDC093546 TaxID=3366040 RepID=UPI00380A686C